jgi:hypothetical protein
MTNYRSLPSSLLVCLFLAFAIPTLPQGTGVFDQSHFATTPIVIDAPGAGTGALQGTTVIAIDTAGDVAGTYIDAIGVHHGFIRYVNGTTTTFDVPGSVTTKGYGTFVSAMDIAGDVAGYYTFSQFGQTYGFVRTANGVITTFNASSYSANTSAIGINSLGTVTGTTYEVNGFNSSPGFIGAANGAITAFGVPVPGQPASDNYETIGIAINTAGVIAGKYMVDSSSTGFLSHGFIRAANGTIATFDPANVTASIGQNSYNQYIGTLPTSIDTAGDIAGSYTDTNGARHSFVRSASGVITSFDPPGTDPSPCPSGNTVVICGSGASAINDAGQIVGVYIDADGVGHGFLRAANGNITSIDVPNAGTGSNQGTAAFAINAAGTIAGTYVDTNSVLHGFVGTAAPTTTTTTLTALQSASVFNEPANFTATISSGSGTPPNGELVYFLNGTTQLGSAPLTSGVASFTTTALPVGADSITVSYAGDTNFAGSTAAPVSQTVGKATSLTTLTSSPNPSTSQQSVTLTAAVSGQFGGTPTGSLIFSNGGTTLGSASLSAASATLMTSALPAGTDSITAVYSGDANFGASTSNAVSQVVTQVATPGFTVAATPALLSVTGGQSGTTTVSVTPLNGFSSAVSFACSGLPAGASCSFAPPMVTPSGGVASTTLTVTTAATTAALQRNSRPLFPGSVLAVALCCFGWKRRRRLQMLVLLLLSVAGLSLLNGCGGASSVVSSPPPVISTVTVAATSGSLSQTTTLILTVN